MDHFRTWSDLYSEATAEEREDPHLYWPFGFPRDFLIYCRHFANDLLHKHFPYRHRPHQLEKIFHTHSPLYSVAQGSEETSCDPHQPQHNDADEFIPQKRVFFTASRLAASRDAVRHLFTQPPTNRSNPENQRSPVELYPQIKCSVGSVGMAVFVIRSFVSGLGSRKRSLNSCYRDGGKIIARIFGSRRHKIIFPYFKGFVACVPQPSPLSSAIQATAGAFLKAEADARRLSNAVRAGDIHLVAAMLDSGTAADSGIAASSSSHTHLHVAASFGRVEVLAWMLATNLSIDVPDWGGNTPLHSAVLGRAHDSLKLLISSGASIEATNHMYCITLTTYLHNLLAPHRTLHSLIHSISKQLLILWFVSVTLCLRNETALHLASKHGNIEAAEVLLNAGASTCARDISHLRTALHLAISHNHQSLALLLASRAPFSDLDLLDDNHETPLHLAVKNSLPAVVSALLQAKANIESENIDRLTPLLLACSHDHHTECLDALLAAGANVDSLDVFQWGALHRACKHGCRSAVVRLLSSGAHTDVSDMELRTPLYLAACGGHENCVDELLQASASVCACDRTRRTSLHMAAIKNYPEIARRLLAKGADANAKDINLMTPLHLAAQHGHDAVIELLVNAHTDIDALDTHKYSALDWAAANDHMSSATQLLQARISDANRKNGIEIAKSRGHYNIADAINRMSSEPEKAK